MKKNTVSLLLIILSLFVLFCTSCANNAGNLNITEKTNKQQTDDGDPFTFSSVSELKNAIKKTPKYYNGKKITVQGTAWDRDAEYFIVDFNGSSIGAQAIAEILQDSSRYIEIIISDEILSAVLETGDYINLVGTVKISGGEVYLDNCQYTMIATRDER